MNWYLAPFRKYADFSGRARRTEFWVFYMGNIVLSLLVLLLDVGWLALTGDDGSYFTGILRLAIFLPSFAVAVRRMHDGNNSGWMILIPLVNLVLLLSPGTNGDNNYGPDPRIDVATAE